MSDIYLSITETPAVVTLSQPVISGALSSTVTVANTVTVALDANSLSALEQVTVTVGAAVSVSNFPTTQSVAGTVTANLNLPAYSSYNSGGIPIMFNFGEDSSFMVGSGGDGQINHRPLPVQNGLDSSGNTLPLTISGTVTASLNENTIIEGGEERILGTNGGLTLSGGVGIAFNNGNASGVVGANNPLPISGTVTVGNSVTIGSLPAISGTVTAAAPNGTLTTRFGTPTTANTAFASSCVTNANRKYLLIQNVTTGSNVITVGIGFTPTTTQGIQLTAGAGITFESSYIPTGAVYVLSSVTASNFTILEA
jgi:hypothetical protein